MEVCQRCGQEGEDRRTLWMACFYEMGELGLPFEQYTLFHAKLEELTPAKEPGRLNLGDGKTITIRAGTVKSNGELSPRGFYTLRVCKGCRADWLRAIKAWFDSIPDREPEGEITKGAAYVRDFGSNRRMTQEEIDAKAYDCYMKTCAYPGPGKEYRCNDEAGLGFPSHCPCKCHVHP